MDSGRRQWRHSIPRLEAQRKERNVVVRPAMHGEVGKHFANHRGELKAMAGAGRRKDDLRMGGMFGDDKVLIWGQCVHAGRIVTHRPEERRHPLANQVLE